MDLIEALDRTFEHANGVQISPKRRTLPRDWNQFDVPERVSFPA